MDLLDLTTRSAWRTWLATHHETKREVWLVFRKRHTAAPSIAYEDAVEEALCFGWIDSIVRRLDDDRYARKFTPRRPDSRWSAPNIRRYERVKSAGLLAAAGRRLAPPARQPRAGSRTVVCLDLEEALRANARAKEVFEALAPSYRRMYALWVEDAKREETRRRRIAEAIERLERGEKLGLK